MMHNSKSLKLVLASSGLIAAGIGGGILIIPDAFYAAYGIQLGNNVILFSEIRATDRSSVLQTENGDGI